ADVEAQGKTVEVSSGFATEVKLELPPSSPVKLPPLPAMAKDQAPKPASGPGPQVQLTGTVVSFSGVGPGSAGTAVTGLSPEAPTAGVKAAAALESKLTVGNPIQGYHVQIAGDAVFLRIIMDRHYSSFEKIDLKNVLKPGNYWVRISLVDLLGLEGSFTAPRMLTIADVPPKLEINSPKPGEKLYEPELLVLGITSHGSRVIVNARPAVMGIDGGFSASVRLMEGANEVSITAVGPGGLKTTVSRTVLYATSKESATMEVEAPEKSMMEQIAGAVGGGFGLTLLISGLMVITAVLIVLL
ncbi:MAG: hypothetical protein ABIG11_00185, partial [bacterium]